MTDSKIFTPDEVESLNAYQVSGAFHPFTCGGDRTDEKHLDGEGLLIATENGWNCPFCSYTQTSAHPWMKDWSWKTRMAQVSDIMNFGDKDAKS
jgi:hypothetical protein